MSAAYNGRPMSGTSLELLAGPDALALIREHGLSPERVDVFAGASGGPKWLVLAELDRLLFGEFFPAQRSRPLHLIGSSIGAWRVACLAMREPVAALERLREGYIEQYYPPKPSAAQVSEQGRRILAQMLGSDGEAQILAHPWARLHVLTTHCAGLTGHAHPRVQLAAFLATALANAVDRRTLGRRLTRVVFHSAGADSPFRELADLPTRHLPLTQENLRPALMASGSIPMVLEGVSDIPGAPGVYRDGGIVDYHLDLDYGPGEGIVLYPHFYPYIVPGWFDKALRWRRAGVRNFRRALLIAPSAAFVARLPYGKIPDRNDFAKLPDAERVRYWRQVVREGARLADEFRELVASGRLAGTVRAFG